MNGNMQSYMLTGFVIILAAAAAFGVGTSINQKVEIEQQAEAASALRERLVDSMPPVEILETGPAFFRGGQLIIRFRARRDRSCPFYVITNWRNDENTMTPQFNPNKAILVPGEQTWIELPTDPAPSMARGMYDVQSIGVYNCGSFEHRIATDWREVTYK